MKLLDVINGAVPDFAGWERVAYNLKDDAQFANLIFDIGCKSNDIWFYGLLPSIAEEYKEHKLNIAGEEAFSWRASLAEKRSSASRHENFSNAAMELTDEDFLNRDINTFSKVERLKLQSDLRIIRQEFQIRAIEALEQIKEAEKSTEPKAIDKTAEEVIQRQTESGVEVDSYKDMLEGMHEFAQAELEMSKFIAKCERNFANAITKIAADLNINLNGRGEPSRPKNDS